MTDLSLQLGATLLFAVAIAHTFSTPIFAHLAHIQPRHAGFWHLLAEVEVVFGFWAFILMIALFGLVGAEFAVGYIEGQAFAEPMFVFVIMVIAASRPILLGVSGVVEAAAGALPVARTLGMYFLCLAAVPMLGSLITEPAAMTLAALLLRERFYQYGLSRRLQYATLGLLFVNVSIGGTLTNFAAPPVLMVAAKWQWSSFFMLSQIGWKSAAAIIVSALACTWLFREELLALDTAKPAADEKSVNLPASVTLIHALFLFGVVMFSHHPVIFMGLFLFFLGYTEAYAQYQDRLIIREGLMVAFFLAGLVVLGGFQQWWLQAALSGVEPTPLYFIATALTAITDNAALTYLASLVDGVTPEFKYAVVTGAVTGGGLTIIANAPNPAGAAILKNCFEDEAISPLGLFLAATPPTLVAIVAFRFL